MNVVFPATLLPTVVPLLAQDGGDANSVILSTVLVLLTVAVFVGIVIFVFNYGKLWLQAYMSNAPVNPFALVFMSLRQVHPRTIVEAKIMGRQAGIGLDPETGDHDRPPGSSLPSGRQCAASHQRHYCRAPRGY